MATRLQRACANSPQPSTKLIFESFWTKSPAQAEGTPAHYPAGPSANALWTNLLWSQDDTLQPPEGGLFTSAAGLPGNQLRWDDSMVLGTPPGGGDAGDNEWAGNYMEFVPRERQGILYVHCDLVMEAISPGSDEWSAFGGWMEMYGPDWGNNNDYSYNGLYIDAVGKDTNEEPSRWVDCNAFSMMPVDMKHWYEGAMMPMVAVYLGQYKDTTIDHYIRAMRTRVFWSPIWESPTLTDWVDPAAPSVPLIEPLSKQRYTNPTHLLPHSTD